MVGPWPVRVANSSAPPPADPLQLNKRVPGRPRGVTMPCGWGCGYALTVRRFQEHFKTCPNRPVGGDDGDRR
jgi:hypothetical protein